MPTTKRAIDLGMLSFYWRMRDETTAAAAADVPTFLPFSFGFDPDVQLITQAPDPTVLQVLRSTYLQDHNIGYMQLGHALADKYGQDFLRFVREVLGGCDPPVRSILDVGCGGGYVLAELKRSGYDVFGVDPSPVATRVGRELGIPIAVGFYPVDHGFGLKDVVLSSGVLEHVPDPVSFLRSHRDDLREGGWLVVSVPDSTPSIERGDLSMILHEHVSYFDEDSLRRTVVQAGFQVTRVARAGYGASFYCLAQASTDERREAAPSGEGASWTKFDAFASRVDTAIQRFGRYVGPLLENPRARVGFYVPLRALPYLSVLKSFEGFRFFDDDPGVHGKMFDGFDIAVEDFADLREEPLTHMIVMSLPHAPVISAKIRAAFGDRIAITTLEAILSDAPPAL